MAAAKQNDPNMARGLLLPGLGDVRQVAATSNFRLTPQDPPDLSPIPLEALPFAAAIVDGSGKFARINPEWKRAFGATVGISVLDWFAGIHAGHDQRAAFGAALRALGANEPSFSLDFAPLRLTATCVPGGILLIVQATSGSAEDPDRAAQSQKMETVGRLASGVAHDFANILTLIAGYSDILLNRIGPADPSRPELDEIRKAAIRGSRLTAQLLGYTRGQTAQPRLLDLNALVLDIQRMLRPIIGENVEWQTELTQSLGRVLADPGQMEQVIMNLILNARDAMPAGGRISIETINSRLDPTSAREHSMEPGPCVLLSITDTGHGIDSAAINHIFEPFFTTKQKGKGTGLGLSTVLGIVREAGGDIWVQSAPGEGATFTLCLPRRTQTHEPTDTAPAPRTTGSGTETVLLVEDEDGVRRLLQYVLNKRGYKVLEAASGEDALEVFEKHSAEIDLVLTDIVMPKMNGRELADRLREIRPELKVVYMSGYTDDVLVRTGALGPGMSFLQKPLRPDVLAAKVREALDSPSRPFNPR